MYVVKAIRVGLVNVALVVESKVTLATIGSNGVVALLEYVTGFVLGT